MREKPKYRFRPKFLNGLFMFIGGLMFTIPGLTMLFSSVRSEFIQIPGLGIGLVFFLIGISLIIHTLKLPVLEIYDDRLKIFYWRGFRIDEVLFSEIKAGGWREVKDDDWEWEELKIITENKSYLFSSQSYHDFKDLKKAFNRHIKNENWKVFPQQEKVKNSVQSVIWGIVGLLMIIFGLIQYSASDSTDFILVHDALAERPIVDEGRAGKGGQNVTFHLENYPDFRFIIDQSDFRTADIDAIKNYLNEGDSLFLGVSIRDYQIKLVRTVQPDFTEKRFNWEIIEVNEVTDGLQSYFSKRKKSESNFNFLLFPIGIALLGWAVYSIFKK